jgi:NADH-quinone oxidoreductase subunit M
MLLTGIIFLPLLVALLLVAAPSKDAARWIAFIGSVCVFAVSLMLLQKFDGSSHQIQLAEIHPWIEKFGINYFIGVDGISLWLVLLTTFLTPLTILVSWKSVDTRVKSFNAAILILETAMLGTFLSMDAVLFYFFWEMMLVPMYLLVGVWGGERRIYAAVKFFIYTMVGSVFMLLAIIALMYYSNAQLGHMSASILDFYRVKIPFDSLHVLASPQTLMFFAFALAFAIKVPMFPLHTWLPDAHAGVLLKMGTYGFLRFAIPLFPEAVEHFSYLFIYLGVFGIIYGALVAMVQPDMKKLVAYSSVSHLGYVVLGLFTLNAEGVTGSLYQMLNHGVSTGGLFLLVGMIYERTHSREISKYGGLAKVLPVFAIMFFLITLSSIAVPGTNGFIGEFLILLGTFQLNKWLAVFAVTGVVWGAVYMLWMYKRIFFGPPGELVPESHDTHHHTVVSDENRHHKDAHPLLDLNFREIAIMIPLLILVFWMGLFPNQFLNKTKASIDYFVSNHSHYNLSLKLPLTSEAIKAVVQK